MIKREDILKLAKASSSIKLGEYFFPSDKLVSILNLTKGLTCHFRQVGQVLEFHYCGPKCSGHISLIGQDKSKDEIKEETQRAKDKKKAETLQTKEERRKEREKKKEEKDILKKQKEEKRRLKNEKI
jgi:hypothetical protein